MVYCFIWKAIHEHDRLQIVACANGNPVITIHMVREYDQPISFQNLMESNILIPLKGLAQLDTENLIMTPI
jgi:hypothetical protein